jgi:ribonuclease HI
MSHAHRATTINQAEYHGLLTGLRAERAHHWPNLEVVGDSALILRRLRDCRPPKNPRSCSFTPRVVVVSRIRSVFRGVQGT